MGAFGRRVLRLCVLSTALVLGIALAAALVRLLPWLLAPDVPFDVSLPFAKALAAVAAETAFLVGVPMGYALAAALFVERGEARALFALGASPRQIVMSSGSVAAVLAAATFLTSIAWGPEANTPGRFANQLILRGRASCRKASRPRSALVPLVGVTWLCFPGVEPRVSGPLPGSAHGAWFTAAELRASSNLRSFRLRDLRLAVRTSPSGAGAPRATEQTRDADAKLHADSALRLHVAHARISGLAAWGRPPELPTRVRAGMISAGGASLGLLLAWLVLRLGLGSRLGAATFATTSSLVALAVLQGLDQSGWHPDFLPGSGQPTWASGLRYVLVPLTGVAVALAAALAALSLLGIRRRLLARKWSR